MAERQHEQKQKQQHRVPIVRPGASPQGPPGWAEAQQDQEGTMEAERVDEYLPQEGAQTLGSRKEHAAGEAGVGPGHGRQSSASTYNTAQTAASSASSEPQSGKEGLGAKIKDKIHLVGEKMALVPAKEGREGLDDVERAARTQVSSSSPSDKGHSDSR